MARNRRRDPYRNFNFLVALGAVVGGIAALGIFRRLFAGAEIGFPGVYLEETPTAVRAIEGVGTSTAGLVGTLPKPTKRRVTRERSRSSK